MATFETKLLKKEPIAKDTMAFTFEKPEEFEYKAGQFCDLILVNSTELGEGANVHTFSLVSEPEDDELVFATRLRDSAYKRELKNLTEGTVVKIKGPFGNYKLHKTETTPAVFVIGGIGITPVKGIIADATHKKLPHEITLHYSNRYPDDDAFLEDFKKLAKENEHFQFVPVMTKEIADKWDGERGHVDANMLKKYVTDVSKPIYYLSGPPGMVQAMYDMLVEAGANEDNIRAEEFGGY